MERTEIMKKLFGIIIFLVVIASTVLPFITVTHTAYADGWYQSYGYRRSITINGSADGAQTNYQLKLTVNNSSGVSSGSTVYLNGSSLNFPNDIRFTNSSQTSLLDYWVETNTSVVATVWVEFDSIVSGATNQSTFYIYYGNASAASASNASTTFIIWNDGTSTTGWTDKDISGKGSITWATSSGKIRGTADTDYDGGFLYCDTQTGINSYFVHTEITAGDGLTGLNTQEGMVTAATQQTGDVGHLRWVDLDNKWSITDEAGGSDTTAADNGFDASQTNEYILTRNASISALYVNGGLKVSHSKSSWSPQYIGFYYYGQTAAHYSGYDNTFVGKWVYNAPTITAWGTATPPVSYYTLSVTGNNSAGTPYFTGSSPFESGTVVNIYANMTNSCYTFAGWTPTTDIASPSSVNTTITMNANAALTASYAIKTYTLTYTNGSNGGITGSLSQTVNCSANGSAVTASGNAHYHFVNWSDASTQNPRTDTNVVANISVTANFIGDNYTLTYTAGAHGTINGTTPQTVIYQGSGTAVTAVPNANYHFVNWSDASTQNPRTDTSVAANISVTANFVGNDRTLTYNAGAHGHVDGNTAQTVPYGTDGTAVTADPDACYHFTSWSDASTTNPRTDTNVTTNLSVTASFAIDVFTLTYSAGAGGSIVGSTPQNVNCGGSGSQVTATPSSCYHFVSWSDAVMTASRTDTGVVANLSVTATFAINTFTLTYSAGAGGSINGTTPQTVNCGANGSAVTAQAGACYSFVNWSDGLTTNPRTDTNILANKSVTANFQVATYTLTVTAGNLGGTPTFVGTSPFDCGDIVTIHSGVTGCYDFDYWAADADITNPNASTTTVEMTENKSLTVYYSVAGNISAPTALSASADSSGNTLTITKALSTYSTSIRYSTATYPTSIVDGTFLVTTSGTSYLHTGTTAGTTYYYSAFTNSNGCLSGNYTTAMVTTTAGSKTSNTSTLPETNTSDWFTTPNGSALENNPLYGLGNMEADAIEMPYSTWWFILGMGVLIVAGLLIYTRTDNLLLAVIVVIVLGCVMATQLLIVPLWIIIVFGIASLGLSWKELR